MARQRNNFSRLPYEVRRLIMRLYLDGVEQADICRDPQISAELALRGITLHSTTFAAMERGSEYQEYKRSRESCDKRTGADRWAAEALRDAAGISNVADMAQMRLLESLRDLAEAGSGEPGDLLKLANAVTRIKASDQQRQIDELKQKLADSERIAAAREAELQAEIADLTARLAEAQKALVDGPKTGGITEKTLTEIEQQVGMM